MKENMREETKFYLVFEVFSAANYLYFRGFLKLRLPGWHQTTSCWFIIKSEPAIWWSKETGP